MRLSAYIKRISATGIDVKPLHPESRDSLLGSLYGSSMHRRGRLSDLPGEACFSLIRCSSGRLSPIVGCAVAVCSKRKAAESRIP